MLQLIKVFGELVGEWGYYLFFFSRIRRHDQGFSALQKPTIVVEGHGEAELCGLTDNFDKQHE